MQQIVMGWNLDLLAGSADRPPRSAKTVSLKCSYYNISSFDLFSRARLKFDTFI